MAGLAGMLEFTGQMPGEGRMTTPRDEQCGNLSVEVPAIPVEALDFAKAVADLAQQNGIRECKMDIRVDTGYRTRYWDDRELEESIHERVTISVSTVDSRGRPRLKIWAEVKTEARVPIVLEPDTPG